MTPQKKFVFPLFAVALLAVLFFFRDQSQAASGFGSYYDWGACCNLQGCFTSNWNTCSRFVEKTWKQGLSCSPNPCTTNASCGNGRCDSGETAQNCPRDCQQQTACGNRRVEAEEQCDDGNSVNYDACVNCRNARCGDGYVRTGVEQCESTSDCRGGQQCTNCMCTGSTPPPRCGDGRIDSGEQCDDGNAVLTDACVLCRIARCGDEFVQTGVEQCEQNGHCNTGQLCSNCMCTARPAVCGNGQVETGEQCDDGNSVNTDACVNCRNARCGDQFVRTGVEQCEQNGHCNTGQLCSNCTCSAPAPFCGNRQVETGEQCDDGNVVNTDACVNCRSAVCGDGSTWSGIEQCDDANAVYTDACVQCRNARCGDNYVRSFVEDCDFGGRMYVPCHPTPQQRWPEGSVCSNQCSCSTCGNGRCDVEAGETTQTCRQDCLQQQALCGNGRMETGEQCDDGNTASSDGCSPACTYEFCGDGIIQTPHEQCDDRNTRAGDGCSPWCKLQ